MEKVRKNACRPAAKHGFTELVGACADDADRDDLRAVGAKLDLKKGERRPEWLPAGRTLYRGAAVAAGWARPSLGFGIRCELFGQRAHSLAQFVGFLDDERAVEPSQDRRDPVEPLNSP